VGQDRFDLGLKLRKQVLGADYVERSMASADEFSMPMQELSTEYCWGHVWTRPGLALRDRSLINIGMISALNRPHELKLHVKAALNNGVTREEIREVLLQVAVYCGVPAGIDSVRIAREAFAEIDQRTPQEQLVLDFFRILSSGDLEAIRATLHPDATWRPMVEGVPGAGVHGPRDKIVDGFLAPVRGLFVPGDPKTTVERMVSTDDTVMCESRGRGTLRDGRRYDNRYAWSIDVRDGRIFAIREYMDSHYVATLFGGGA